MAKIDNPGIWEKIQRNVQETERLMGQKQYNLSMIKARQTLEYMVKLQCDKAGIVESNTETMIRELFNGKWITKPTAEHYLQILSIGNKAAKEGDNSAYNANQAYHVLSQEIYSFADADRSPKMRRSAAQQGQTAKSRRKQPKSGLNSADLFKLLIPVVLVIVLILIIRVLTPSKTPTDETTSSSQATTAMSEAPTMESSEAPAETTASAVSYKTTTTLNVRKGPSTDSDRIGKLDPGASVEYIRDYEDDDFWAVIQYNDQEAYVAKQYLVPAE